MNSMYEEVLLPIRVPVGVYCFKSDEPFPVTCGYLDCSDHYPRCMRGIGEPTPAKSGRVFKPAECIKLRRNDYV